MYLFPVQNETMVLPYPEEDVYNKLWIRIKPVRKNESMPDQPEKEFYFNGWIHENRFNISQKLVQPQNFLPLITGRIESTSVGSIIFVKYSLFFSTIIFLVFWTVVTILIALFFFIYQQLYLYGFIALGMGILNYLITLVNFKIQVKKSRETLENVLA